MDEFQSNLTVVDEEEENLIALAKIIVKAFESKKKLTSDTRKKLADLGTRLSKIALANDEDHKDPTREIEELLNKIQERIMKWEVDQSVIWDCGPDEAQEYLNAVDEARKLIEKLESSNLSKGSEEKELLQKAHDLLQTGMVRLGEEFRHLIAQNRQPFELEHMSFRSSEDDSVDCSSIDSFRDDSVEDVVIQQDCIARASDENVIPLVNPDVIPHLRSISNLMFDSNYGHECSQAYISVRKDALDSCLNILDIEKYSIEDVMKMEWKTLNNEIRKWIWAIKVFVRVYLVSEKWLSDQIFKAHESVGTQCFLESSKASILQLLNFGEAISVGPHKSEKLIRILDMYEVLADLVTDINLIYSDNEAGSSYNIRIEFQDILKRVGDCAKATYFVFEKDVAKPLSLNPFPGGGVHHLNKYVMNYLKTLADYTKTLDLLLQDHDLNCPVSCSPEDQKPASCVASSPVSLLFHSLLSILEKNLSNKSNLYKDEALRHLFLMNNIHYISEKVKCCTELRNLLGDNWIRKQIGKFQRHSMGYERVSWFSILALLKNDGLYNSGSKSISRTLLKEKLQSFYNAFEEVYKKHTGWIINDFKLREEMRISTSLKIFLKVPRNLYMGPTRGSTFKIGSKNAMGFTVLASSERVGVGVHGAGIDSDGEFPSFLPMEILKIKDQPARNLAQRIQRLPVQIGRIGGPIMSSCIKPKMQNITNPIVLLHSFDSSCLEWRCAYPLLENAGLETWAVDILGWGFCDLERRPPCNAASKRYHLYQLWRTHIKRPMTLVGPSLGAAVAIDFALHFPEAVDKLVLIDASVYAEGTGFMRNIPRTLAYAAVSLLKSFPLRLCANTLAFDNLSLSTSLDLTNVGRLHCLLPWWEDATVDFMLSGGYNVANDIKQVKKKCMIIWGQNDNIISKKDAKRLQEDLPNATMHQVPNCGHLPHVEKPACVAKLIADFAR